MKQVVKDMDDVFTTKDVSEDLRVINAHRKLANHSQYHGFVGGALSDHRRELGIDELQKGTQRGSRWGKKVSRSGFIQAKQPPRLKQVNIDQGRKVVEHVQEPKVGKFVSLACPSCCGELKKDPTSRHYVCSHCKNSYIYSGQ